MLKDNHSLWLVGFLLAMTCTETSQAETLKVCYDQWAPMTMFTSPESSQRGVVIDMLEHIYTSEGYTLEYYEVPLARGLEMVENGLCDILPEYLPSQILENDFEYADEESFAYTTAFVVRRNDPWRYSGMESIIGKRIATGPGWDYSSVSVGYQNYLDNPDNKDFVEVIAGFDDVVDRILQMITQNRVDLYADNAIVLQYALNQLNLNDELEVISPGFENKLREFPIFSKKIPNEKRQELIRIWDEGRLLLEGEKERAFLQKYSVVLED